MNGHEAPGGPGTALVLTGGGARGAYQVGVLRGLARAFPGLRLPILTGVSAGAINAAQMAGWDGPFAQAAEDLHQMWRQVTVDRVFHAEAPRLLLRTLRASFRLATGGAPGPPAPRGLVDTQPLRQFVGQALRAVGGSLPGISANLKRGRLQSVAITASSYGTGRSVTWVMSREPSAVSWVRAHRLGGPGVLTVDHVMASAALPVIFPAVEVEGEWFGDGGVRLTAPLSPAVHLGAERILVVSTRYARRDDEGQGSAIDGYPPLAQVAGSLLNALFLDMLDSDALRLERINQLVRAVPEARRNGLRPIDLLVLRPSRDLGRMANDYEPELPRAFRFLTRGLGTRETRSNDLLSLVMFQPDYVRALLDLGEQDALDQRRSLAAFLQPRPEATA